MISANVGKFRYVSQKAEYRCSAKRKGKKKKERKEGRAESVSLSCSVFFWRGLGTPSFTCKIE